MKIVYKEKTATGESVVIRYPSLKDLKVLHQYANALSREKTFVIFQGEKISLKEEKEYLMSHLKNIRGKRGVLLFLFVNNTLAGVADIRKRKMAIVEHIASLGISISKEYRGRGLGKILMECLLKESINNLPVFKICILGVFSENTTAINLYKKLGFQEFGRLSNGLKLGKRYTDEILMYKNVSSFQKRAKS